MSFADKQRSEIEGEDSLNESKTNSASINVLPSVSITSAKSNIVTDSVK